MHKAMPASSKQTLYIHEESNDDSSSIRHGRDAKRQVYDQLHIGRVHEYFLSCSPRSIWTRVHLELTIINSCYGSSEVIMVSSMTSTFYSAKRRRSWMNFREKVSKSFRALLSCLLKIFVISSNVNFVIDSTLRVCSTKFWRLIIYTIFFFESFFDNRIDVHRHQNTTQVTHNKKLMDDNMP